VGRTIDVLVKYSIYDCLRVRNLLSL